MAKRVAVVLSGCGAGDGSEIREAVLTLLALDRAGAQVICAAPDVSPAAAVRSPAGASAAAAPPRQALVEAARIARRADRQLAELTIDRRRRADLPGRRRASATVLSNYAEKGQLCDVASATSPGC